MCDVFDSALGANFISELKLVDSKQKLDQLSMRVNDLGWRAAKVLPLTGGLPRRSPVMKRLEELRKSISELRSAVRKSANLDNPNVRTKLSKCRFLGVDLPEQSVFLQLSVGDLESLLGPQINKLSRSIRKEFKSMRTNHKPRDGHNFAAHVHQMLTPTSAAGSKLNAVVDPLSGKLTQTPRQLKSVLFDSFSAKFKDDRSNRVHDPDIEKMYEPLRQVDEAWYSDLMQDFTINELKQLGSSLKKIAAPADDKVSAGVWKILLDGSKWAATVLSLLFNSCLRLRYFPQIGRSATIVPLLKKQSEGMVLSNIRPISLQNAMMKILSKGLAHRLAKIFSRHDILHPAQEGFLKGGSTGKCIDALLDVWEDANLHKKECISIFYDLAGAYDTVPHDRLLASLARIKLPQTFIELVKSSLHDCKAHVRTAFGPTPQFSVERSIKQGDPLAPLLFIIFMDPLHTGLDRNPLFDNCRDGYKLKTPHGHVVVSSKGYADDTTLVAGSLAGAKRMNLFTERWCAHNGMKLSGPKTEVAGCLAGGALIPAGSLVIAGTAITPKRHHEAVRHLGVLVQFDLDWKSQNAALSQVIGRYATLAVAHKLSVAQCVIFFQTFLQPKLEYVLRFNHAPDSVVMKWNQLLSWAIFKCSGSCQRTKMWSLEEITGLTLVSTKISLTTISESFLRLNEVQRNSYSPHLRLPVMEPGLRPAFSKYNRLTKTAQLINDLNWTIERVNRRRSNGLVTEYGIPFGAKPYHAMLPPETDQKYAEDTVPLIFGHQGIFSNYGQTGSINLYTDGSARVDGWDEEKDRFEWASSYSVVAGDAWLEAHFRDLPDEKGLRGRDLEGALAVAFQTMGECHENAAYFVELAAITRAVMAAPSGVDINIYTDSLSSIQAIERYGTECNDRRRLRTAGRPFLGLISEITQRRSGSVRYHHVRSHTDLRDVHSSGNKIADHVADDALPREDSSASQWLMAEAKKLPLHLGERNVVVKDSYGRVVAGDMRRAVEHAAKARNVGLWKMSNSQGTYAGPFYKDLRRMIFPAEPDKLMVQGREARQRQLFMLNAVSDTLHFTVSEVDGKNVPHEQYCEACDGEWELRNVRHLFDCPALSRHRQDAAGDVLEEVRSLLPAWDEWKGDGSFEDKFTAHGYFLTFPTELVLLVGKVMRRDENDDKKQEQLLDDTAHHLWPTTSKPPLSPKCSKMVLTSKTFPKALQTLPQTLSVPKK